MKPEPSSAQQQPKSLLPLTIKDHYYDWPTRTYLMGIINLTPDSFSRDGLYQSENYIDLALKQAERMTAAGADFLDLGAESSRPGATPVAAAEEEARLLPVLKELLKAVKVPVSVDTYKPAIAEQALNLGADLINDIWGLQHPDDPEHRMAQVVAQAQVPVVVMHNQKKQGYRQLVPEIIASLQSSIALAEAAGVKRERIILDPGIGFAKTREENLQVLREFDRFKVLGQPLLLATSRKSLIGLTLDLPVEQRLEGTIATVVWGIAKGANIVRVHDLPELARAVRMTDAIIRS